eukprot:TRINITY_DN9865_c0_g1_i1.p1 TRINITY_DN9865_c0_g1~~TRINITY_DN9865_c0_g1_i1.p1  ORF type:complete len:177 (-),score=31.13 TRINITY_DN9865_c0_g1_i1:6-536(-)
MSETVFLLVFLSLIGFSSSAADVPTWVFMSTYEAGKIQGKTYYPIGECVIRPEEEPQKWNANKTGIFFTSYKGADCNSERSKRMYLPLADADKNPELKYGVANKIEPEWKSAFQSYYMNPECSGRPNIVFVTYDMRKLDARKCKPVECTPTPNDISSWQSWVISCNAPPEKLHPEL